MSSVRKRTVRPAHIDAILAQRPEWRRKLYIIIFEADTPAGRAFDVLLLVSILLSILVIMLDSVQTLSAPTKQLLYALEWAFTGFFTLEFILRLISAPFRWHYVRSFYGLVDILSIMPSYLSLFLGTGSYFIIIRGLRLLRVFRVLKLTRFLGEADTLQRALRASLAKIIVFIGVVLTVVLIVGATMYIIEGPENGFKNIPLSTYWAIVTLTTVGYGDIAPQTTTGQTLAAVLMILGYGIIAVPTGIVSVELNRVERKRQKKIEKTESLLNVVCPGCKRGPHQRNANYCFFCGESLNKEVEVD